MTTLEGKRIFITGSGQGIGAAIVELAIARGASVVISDIDAELAEKTAARLGAVGTSNGDVSDEASIAAAVEGAIELLGGLDVPRPEYVHPARHRLGRRDVGGARAADRARSRGCRRRPSLHRLDPAVRLRRARSGAAAVGWRPFGRAGERGHEAFAWRNERSRSLRSRDRILVRGRPLRRSHRLER